MRNYLRLVAAIVVGVSLSAGTAEACTTILVTKGASSDGSIFVSHSDDGIGDSRIMFVPAADHPGGSVRHVYYDAVSMGFKPEWGGTFTKRYVGTDRGPDYVDPAAPQSIPIGEIPQVAHTYAYIDGNYGVINEKQLAIGECTDEAKVETQPESGKRIFYSAELSRVALERCSNARDAITLMGELIAKYGYYGTAETLLVADTGEGWVMEMCSYDENGTDGVWVAKKVPDGEVFVAANCLRIRDVDPSDPDMMYSSNLFDVAKAKGWWDPNKDPKMDWAKTFGTGEGLHPYAALRRVWRIMSRLSPSSDFSPWVKNTFTTTYPFSITPDSKLDVPDVMSLHRDHYEGTLFDLTKNPAGGPFGSPQRWRGDYDYNKGLIPGTRLRGAWERPISIYFCAFVYVNQIRASLPDCIGGVSWMGLDEPYNCCLVPLYAGVTNISESYKTADMSNFEWGTSMWWAFNFVNNWIELKYSYAIQDVIAKQSEIEETFYSSRQAVEAEALALYQTSQPDAAAFLTQNSKDCADTVNKAWWTLAATLIAKYADGFINTPDSMGKRVGYPSWWLKQNGYRSGPVKYSKYKPKVPEQIKETQPTVVDEPMKTESPRHGL